MKLVGLVSSLLKHKGSQIWGLAPTATVYDAVEMMSDRHVGALLVLEDGKLAGVISERDYARKVILKGKSSKETPVREIMTTPVITVAPGETVEHCMQLMTDHRIRHLPVVEEGKVVGVLSIGDLVKWTISAQEELLQQLENYITGKYA